MHKKTRYVALISLIALLLAACSSVQAAPLRQDVETEPDQPRTITVNGVGRVTVTPDLARISIGIETRGEDASAAVRDNSDQAEGVMSTLEGFGIATNDIRTTNFSIFPQQERDLDGRIVKVFYVVQNTVNVTIRNLDQVGEVLDAVVQSGANSISGIQFDVADRSPANAEALEAAVVDARSQAEILAEAAGVEVGQVVSINSFRSVPIVPFQRAAVEFAAPADVPISPGELEISVDVTVIYEIQ